MMVLSDREIHDRLQSGNLVVEPLGDLNVQLQPASLDLRLGQEFLEYADEYQPPVDPTINQSPNLTSTLIPEDRKFTIHPGDFVLGTTKERVEIPPDLLATVEGRSSIGRLGVIVHATAGIVDPGFKGQITLELSNIGNTPVRLTPGMRISQLVFTVLGEPSKRPYGEERGSKYQNQRGPQASRLSNDVEFSE